MSVEDQSIDQNEQAAEAEAAEVEQETQENVDEQATEAVDQQVDELKDQVLRVQAEMQNLRRRTEKDVENAHKFGQEKLIKELLPVVDSLERALESTGESDDPVLEGIRMTRDMFLAALEKSQVLAVDPQGEPFDPQLHQAMSLVENPEVEPNTVIAVMQKGYTLHGRLLRPAMVMVSKPAPSDAPTIDEQA